MLRTKAWSERWLEILVYRRYFGREGVIPYVLDKPGARGRLASGTRQLEKLTEAAKQTGARGREAARALQGKK